MNLPTGTVTFLFTDIEGSTKLWEQYSEMMRTALPRHDTLLRYAIEENNGYVFKTMGDAFCAAFPTAPDAIAAVIAAQRALHAEHWQGGLSLRVRMALHTGEAEERGGDYFGQPLNRVARLLSVGHGGQVLLSQATRDVLPADTPLTDKGNHRLKDLLHPEHLFQLTVPDLPSDFPPLRSLHNTNLPIQSTSFIGREREMEEVKRLLATSRLLTLSGSGGCGKTRLALQVAAEVVEDYPDGVWLVELAALSEPNMVVQIVATALGLRDEPGRSLTDTLTNYLHSKSLLLLLDNCEHLVEACASLANTLLRSCPQVKMLATSREPLNVPGEHLWRIPSLFAPDHDDLIMEQTDVSALLMDYDAPRLFVERARVQRQDFVLTRSNVPVVARLCRQLDGIPLAIELAAARVRSLSVEEINGKLDNRFRLLTGGSRTALPRQQTLRALIDWSYDLLSNQEKTLLCRLAVFVGGWTLDAAEQICSGEEIEQWELLDLLTALVDKSLVVSEQEEERTRYRLLETVRQYARDRLGEKVEAATIRERHQAYFMAFTEEAEPHLRGQEQANWLHRLEQEHDNLRAAMEGNDRQMALRIAGGLWWLWYVRGYLSEGRDWLARVLAESDVWAESSERAKALIGAGVLAYAQGDYSEARRQYEESLALRRELGDKPSIAATLNNLGVLAYEQGDYSAARTLHEESLALRRELEDKRSIATSLNNLGLVAQVQDNNTAARAFHEEGLTFFRETGDKGGIAYSLYNLGLVLYYQGDYAQARSFAEESLILRRELGDKGGTAYSLLSLGCVVHDQGDNAAAHTIHEESLSLFRELGDKRGMAFSLHNLGNVASDQGEYMTADNLYQESLTLFRELGQKRAIVGSLEAFAALSCGQEKRERAARLWGAAETLRIEIGAPMQPHDQKKHDLLMAQARAAISEDTFAAAWAEGQAMTMEQSIEYALEENHA